MSRGRSWSVGKERVMNEELFTVVENHPLTDAVFEMTYRGTRRTSKCPANLWRCSCPVCF